MSEKSKAVVAHMLTSVAAITSASAAAEELLSQTSSHIRSITGDVNTSDESDVDDAFEHLEAFADQLDEQASELSAAVVANTPADPAAQTNLGDGASAGSGAVGDPPHPESRAGAAAAGGYDAPQGPVVAEDAGPAPAGGVVADTEAAAAADEGGVDANDGDRITSQEAREGAGPFTGTGSQDALRTSGRLGDTDANVSDQRTVEDVAQGQDGGSADGGESEDTTVGDDPA